MKHRIACLGVAVVLAVALWILSGYTATYATSVIETSGQLSSGEMLLVGAGNFIARWYIVIVAVLLAAAMGIANLLNVRAAARLVKP